MASPFSKLRNVCTRLAGKLLCKNITKYVADNFCYVFEKYVMPVIYVIIVICGLVSAQRSIVPRLSSLEFFTPASVCPKSRFFCHQGTGLSFPPRTRPWAVPVYAVLAVSSWLKVFLTDPGTINSENHRQLSFAYKYDYLLFSPKNCRTCHLRKIARSKHCALCNRCVARFDHHCGWVGTCVGLYNTKYFVIFLAVHTFMVAHGAVLCAEIIRARIQELIRKRYIFVPTNQVIKSFSFRLAIGAETVLSLFFAVLVLLFIMTSSFLGYHIYLILNNTTTNESSKRADVFDAIRRYRATANRSVAQAMKEEAQQDLAMGNTKALEMLPEFGEDEMPVNINDHGYRDNIWEVFSPISFLAHCQREAMKFPKRGRRFI